jgi:hypothetical protein
MLLLATTAQADPITLDVGKFSDHYYAKVTVNESPHDGRVPGVIRVYDRKNPKKYRVPPDCDLSS